LCELDSVAARERRLDVGRPACRQRTYELTPEHAARVQIDVEVAGVVRHAQFFGHRAHAAVDEEPRPRRITLPFGDRQARVTLGEAEVEDVADSDGQRRGDEVEGDGEKRDRGGRVFTCLACVSCWTALMTRRDRLVRTSWPTDRSAHNTR